MFSLGSGSMSLNSMGMPGCTAYLDSGLVLGSYVVMTTNTGSAYIGVELPSYVWSSNLNLYSQWFYLNPGANPRGVQATQGLRTEIR